MRRIFDLTLAVLALCSHAAIGHAAEDDFRLLVMEHAPVRWASSATGGPLVLTYAFADTEIVQPGDVNCGRIRPFTQLLRSSGLSASELQRATTAALARWSAVAAISFVQVAAAADASIVLGEQAEPEGRAFTRIDLGAESEGGYRAIAGAAICLNPMKPWKMGYGGDQRAYDLVHTLAHEIGHAIGLDHPSARGHLMSFRYEEGREGLSRGDALGAIRLYGAPGDEAAPAIVSAQRPRPVREPGDAPAGAVGRALSAARSPR